MRAAMSLGMALCLLVAASAGAHPGGRPWTAAKAERMVERDATVLLPRQQRAALGEELLALIPRYRTLEQVAWDVDDQQAAAAIHNLRYRYSAALKQVEGGLPVAVAACAGTGPSSGGGRFRHFRCALTSEVLEVPFAELFYDDPSALPRIVEREPSRYGPYDTRILVHLTAGSSIAYSQTAG